MYAEYCSKRAATVARLEALPLRAWARTGRHTEFGRVTVLQQVGYFAYHEVYHFPDFVEKRRKSSASYNHKPRQRHPPVLRPSARSRPTNL